jgi:Fe2+/Zn2+ uptake regulation proteins
LAQFCAELLNREKDSNPTFVKEENSYETFQEIFTNYLTERKFRKTSERYAILERIYEQEGHFTADFLFNALKDEYRVSLPTVYNTLELLLNCRLIVKHKVLNQQTLYKKNSGKTVHNYMVCTACGSIKEFSDKLIKTTIQTKKIPRFQISNYSLYVYGLCNKCKK